MFSSSVVNSTEQVGVDSGGLAGCQHYFLALHSAVKSCFSLSHSRHSDYFNQKIISEKSLNTCFKIFVHPCCDLWVGGVIQMSKHTCTCK